MDNLNLILNAIKTCLDPQKIILFGSFLSKGGKRAGDIDVAVLQKDKPRLGQKADVFLTLSRLKYDWKKEPDIHLFSETEFSQKLEEKDLFISEISKGRVVYVKE